MTSWGGYDFCPHCKRAKPDLVGMCARCRKPKCAAPTCDAACAKKR